MNKILKQVKEFEVFNVISRIHDESDFIDGDIEERIESSKYYNHISDYPLSAIDLNGFDVDQDKVDDFIFEIKESGISKMPKIVIDQDGVIIDGVHRVLALIECGFKSIDILKGTDVEYKPEFKKTLMDKELGIYKISNDFGSISIMENAKYSPADNSVSEFLVDEKYRGLGVGTELLKEAMRQYSNLGGQVSSEASIKVFLECGFEPFDMVKKGSFDLDTTSFDFKTFNSNPSLLNGNAAMYRKSIELFEDKFNQSLALFKNAGGSLFFNDQRQSKLEKKPDSSVKLKI